MSTAHFTADYVFPSLAAASKLIGTSIVHFERLTPYLGWCARAHDRGLACRVRSDYLLSWLVDGSFRQVSDWSSAASTSLDDDAT